MDALYSLMDAQGVVSGGKDGVIIIWNRHLEQNKKFDIKMSIRKPVNPGIRSVCVREGKILLGTLGCEIFELDISENENDASLNAKCITQVSTFSNPFVQQFLTSAKGHCKGELWGLGVHPANQEFVSAGDDGNVCLWDAPTRKLLKTVNVGSKARSVSFSPDGRHIAVGMYNGSVGGRFWSLRRCLKRLQVSVWADDLTTNITIVECSKKWIQVLRYSPDGKTLAVGSHDRKIHLLNAPAYTKRAICKVSRMSKISGNDL